MSETLRQDETPKVRESAPPKGTKILAGLRSKIAKAILVVAPVLGSCDVQDDQEGVSGAALTQDTVAVSASENADVMNRKVDLWLNGTEWHFQGKYPEQFHLTVYLDGNPSFNQDVQLSNGAFHVQGNLNGADQVDVQAFQITEDGQAGTEIPIEKDPATTGMYGNPNQDASLY